MNEHKHIYKEGKYNKKKWFPSFSFLKLVNRTLLSMLLETLKTERERERGKQKEKKQQTGKRHHDLPDCSRFYCISRKP